MRTTVLRWFAAVLCLAIALGAAPAVAHDVDIAPSVVIDTDMGLDDAAMMAAALQCPQLRILACVASEGVLDASASAQALGRMLHEFNRGDIALYQAAAAGAHAAPPFRTFATGAVMEATTPGGQAEARPFAPAAYRDPRGGKTMVLAVGPLTNVAAALQDPEVVKEIDCVLIQGPPDPQTNWNVKVDPQAFARLRDSGVRLEFVAGGPAAAKPQSWREAGRPFGGRTSIGEAFLLRLLPDAALRAHYTDGIFSEFTDELVLLYAVDPHVFVAVEPKPGELACARPQDQERIVELYTSLISEGRQVKDRVVFKAGPIPDDILMPDVRIRKAGIIAKNGESEWFAQLLMNELHEHLGSYSILGVKMGLRAAELLNAPQHGMEVVSHSAPKPPVSCINDGVIVVTGSTPGRALFRHEPGEPGSTAFTFACNGRTVRMKVKDEYRGKIQSHIQGLLKQYTLEDDGYWLGVRKMSLEIWENWHRRDLFDVEWVQPAPKP